MSHTDKLWEELTEQIPWRVLIKILKSKGIPTALGKELTKVTIDRYIQTSQQNERNFKSLIIDLKQYLFTGDKIILLMRLDPNLSTAIRKQLSSIDNVSIQSKKFPFRLSEADLERVSTNASELIEKVDSDNRCTLVWRTKRSLKVREDLKDSIKLLEPSKFKDYDEIYGVRTVTVQLMDVTHFDFNENLLEIRLDNSMNLSNREIYNSKSIIENLLKRQFGIQSFSYMNFYPVMSKVYENPKNGRIVEYGFSTGTFSLKHEKMRKIGTDLRKEKYHKAGKAAVASISPYRMGVRWIKADFFEHEYELLLPGTERLVDSNEPEITSAHISYCVTETDLRFIIGTLISLS